MSNALRRRLASLLVLWALVFSGFLVATSAARADAPALPALVAPDSSTSVNHSGDSLTSTSSAADGSPLQRALDKMDSSLQQIASRLNKGYSAVMIYTSDMPGLAKVLESVGAQSVFTVDGQARTAPFTARPWGATGQTTSVQILVPNSALVTIASLDGVAYIQQKTTYAPATIQDEVTAEDQAAFGSVRDRIRSSGWEPPSVTKTNGNTVSPTSWAVAREHNAYDVWRTFGYEGGGVNVAVVDTGEDFGHPSLSDSWAVDQNPASPYFGWPIMFHPASMEGLMGQGWWTAPSDLDRLPLPYFLSANDGDSWYSSTDFRANDTNLDGSLRYATGVPDPLNGAPQYTPRANPQQYGNFHPNWNSRIVRDYYVGCAGLPGPCILSQSGVYHLGLDRDDTLTGLWGEKVGILVVDSTTPFVYDTIYVDLNFNFDFTDDKPVTRADPIAVADLTGDGVPDVSGGLLYFIASSSPITGEVVINSITGTEPSANLANGDVAIDVLGLNLAAGIRMWTPPTQLTLRPPVGADVYLPGATEDLYEEYTGTGADAGTQWALGGPLTSFGAINIMTDRAVDSASLIRGPAGAFPIGMIWDFEDSVGSLTPGVDYNLNAATGTFTWLRNFGAGETVYIIYQLDTYTLEPVSGTLTFNHALPTGWRLLADYETGVPIPYSDIYGLAHGYDVFIPGNGDLIAMHGDFDYGQSHGSFVSSTIAAHPFGNLASPFFEVFGTAPRAKIIGIAACCNVPGPVGLFGSIEDQREFAAVGYDGVAGTGDEAVIMSNSFGSVSDVNTGFSFEDRWLYDFMQRHPTLTSFVAFANNGAGYATGSPGGTSPGVVTVGAGTSGDYRVEFAFDGGEGNYEFPFCPGPPPYDPANCVGVGAGSGDGPGPYGEVAYFSSRGPTLLGQPKPDIVSIGSFAVEAGPMNVLAVNPFTGALDPAWADGNFAFDVFSGTSQATPVTAGVAALGVEAYRDTHGGANPTNTQLKTAMKAGADDMHRDVLQQGAGWTNALRTVRILAEMDGITPSRNFWVPGGYLGVARPAFVNLLPGGGSAATTITVTNHNPLTAKFVGVSDAVYGRMTGPYAWSVSLGTGTGRNYILKSNGIYAADGSTLLQAEPWATQWNTADFAKITWTYDSAAYTGGTSLRVDVFDWYDYQHPVGAPLAVYDGSEEFVTEATQTDYVARLLATGVLGETKAPLFDPVTEGWVANPYAFTRSIAGPLTEVPACLIADPTLFVLDTVNGWITLCAPLADGETLTGDYSVYALVSAGDSFFLVNTGVVPGSETVYMDGAIWAPANYNINYATGEFIFATALSAGDEVEIDYLWDHPGIYDGFSERNRMTVATYGSQSNSVHDSFGLLPSKIHDGLVLNIRSGASAAIPATLLVEFYAKQDWAWITTSSAGLNIPAAGGTQTFTVTATVPAGAAPGLYEGAVYLADGPATTTIPIVINVPVTGFPVNLGGNVPTTSLYDNNGVIQGARSGWRQIGDSRYVWADLNLATNVPGRRMIYNAILQGRLSDPDMLVFNCVADPDGYTADATYGPCRMDQLAGSKEQIGATDTLFTNKEFMHSPVVTGLIAFQVKAYGSLGSAANGGTEPLVANIGIMQATLNGPGNPLGATEVATATNRLTGSVPLTVWANVPMYGGLGSAVTETVSSSSSLAVPAYGYPGGDFVTYLYNAPSKMSTTIAANTISATWSGGFPAGLDIDYGIFYDGPTCDGSYTVADSVAGTAMATSSNPETFTMGFPAPGCYWVHAAGFDVGGGTTTTITLGVNRIGVSAFALVNPPTTDVAPNTNVLTSVGWAFPPSQPEGVVSGQMFLSPGYAPFALAIGLTLSVRYDTTPVTIQDFSPLPGSTVRDVTDARVSVVANVYDTTVRMIDINRAKLWVDGTDVTQLAKRIPVFTDAVTCCYNLLTVAYDSVLPMTDGPHGAVLEVYDVAGNVQRATWSWTVDNTPPTIMMANPAGDGVTRTAALTVQGTAPGASSVTVNGNAATLDLVTGAFSYAFTLAEGANPIAVVATDAVGNSASVDLTVTLDTTAPTLINVRSSEPARTRADSTLISGSVGEMVQGVTLNGLDVFVRADGSFSYRVPLVEGVNTFAVVATDLAGNTATVAVTVTRDTQAPTIALNAPLPGDYITTLNNTAIISGVATGASLVTINGIAVTTVAGVFARAFPMSIGANTFTVEATDDVGNLASATTTVTYAPVVENVQRSYTSVILIGVAVVLLVVGFLVGWAMWGRGGAPPTPEAVPPETPSAGEERPPEPEEMPAEEEMTTEEEEL